MMLTTCPWMIPAGLGLLAAASVSAADAADGACTVGDSQMAIRLQPGAGDIREAAFMVRGRTVESLIGAPAFAQVDGRRIRPSFSLAEDAPAAGPRPFAALTAEDDLARWELEYRLTGPGRITKTLVVLPRKAMRLDHAGLWESSGRAPSAVPRTSLQDIAAFFRADDRGLFASLDFPFSQIAVKDDGVSIGYPPYLALKAGERHVCHSLTFGAVALTGRTRYGFDDGEVDALDAYVQERFKPRFERPLFTSCSIVNRYTQVSGDVVFYTMKDHPTLVDRTDLLERELALMPRLGIEFYQVFPGIFDWGPDDPRPQEVHRLMDVARRNGVRMGDYSGTSGVFCPHYNEHRNRLDRREWLILGPDGRPAGGFCFGSADFVDWYIGTVVPAGKRFGFEVHGLDFLGIAPCHAADHGHPPGRDGVYHQVAGLVRMLEAIDAVSPQMMTWPNSGNWIELLPKLAWSAPNLYLTDPFIVTPWQGLNMTRLLDDARREQMVSLHHSRFLPYRFLTNCQYFFCQNSISPDIRNFEFGALSTLAVTPNLCLAEIRPWLDRLNEADRERVIGFYGRWTTLVRENFSLWKRTFNAGENPGMGAVEIYSHADGNHGFIFLVNPQYWSRTVEVPLDRTLGFDGGGRCEIEELYPVERLRLTPQGPTVALGSKWELTAPAQQVLVLRVRPAPERLDAPRLYGLPGRIEADGSGYLLATHGPQGRSERFAVVSPEGAPPIGSAHVRPDVPRQPPRLHADTPLRLISLEGSAATYEITFRRTPAPSELRDWTVRPGNPADDAQAGWAGGWEGGERLRFPLFVDSEDAGMQLPITDARARELGLGPLANFCGAYVENAFQEEEVTSIAFDKESAPAAQPAAAPGVESPPRRRPLPPQAREPRSDWWMETRFHLPFMYTLGSEPALDEHTILVLPLVRQAECKSIRAWINGVPLEVRPYRYPRNRSLACYHADLVGTGARGGDNLLVLHLQY